MYTRVRVCGVVANVMYTRNIYMRWRVCMRMLLMYVHAWIYLVTKMQSTRAMQLNSNAWSLYVKIVYSSHRSFYNQGVASLSEGVFHDLSSIETLWVALRGDSITHKYMYRYIQANIHTYICTCNIHIYIPWWEPVLLVFMHIALLWVARPTYLYKHTLVRTYILVKPMYALGPWQPNMFKCNTTLR